VRPSAAACGALSAFSRSDLKSLNILIDHNFRAKVADFGMTRIQGETHMTQCGSPLWMAPEMIQNEASDRVPPSQRRPDCRRPRRRLRARAGGL
jgi:serine/threonine protein kinase